MNICCIPQLNHAPHNINILSCKITDLLNCLQNQLMNWVCVAYIWLLSNNIRAQLCLISTYCTASIPLVISIMNIIIKWQTRDWIGSWIQGWECNVFYTVELDDVDCFSWLFSILWDSSVLRLTWHTSTLFKLGVSGVKWCGIQKTQCSKKCVTFELLIVASSIFK